MSWRVGSSMGASELRDTICPPATFQILWVIGVLILVWACHPTKKSDAQKEQPAAASQPAQGSEAK